MEYSILLSRLKTASDSFETLEIQLADPDISNNPKKLESIARERSKLEPLVNDFKELLKIDRELEDSKKLLKESKGDKEMEALINDELINLQQIKDSLIQKLKIALLPKDPRDDRSVMLEIRAGAGGNEACIWAGDLARMYERYGQKIGWSVKPISASESDMGGFKELVISVKGDSVYSQLKFEAGVHRVQRVPQTETQGRVHTSAATVIVLPEAEEFDVELDMQDVRIERTTSTGPGGQSVNTTYSAIKLHHEPTGIIVSCQDQKSQHKNLDKALKVLRTRLYELEVEKRRQADSLKRKSMVSSGDRSAKIRTYNYPQGRVTEHRIGLTLYDLPKIINGDIQKIIDELMLAENSEILKANN